MPAVDTADRPRTRSASRPGRDEARLAVADAVRGRISPQAVRGDRARSSTENGVRRELARELHDLVVQELTATLVDLENFKRQPYDEQTVVDEVDQVQGSLRRALVELRQLLFDLRDEEGWQAGFMSSLQDFAHRCNERRGVHVS